MARSAVGLLLVCFYSCRAVLCCAMCALLSAIIWCTRVTMRCNRFPVSGGVSFTLCAIVRLWRVLQVFTMCLADGGMACAFVSCCSVLSLLVWWIACAVACCLA